MLRFVQKDCLGMTTQNPHQPVLFRFRFPSALTSFLITAIAVVPARGQNPPQPARVTPGIPAAKQAFEAASLRLEDPNIPPEFFNNDPRANQPTIYPANRLIMRNAPLKSMISQAFAVDYGNILGIPDVLLRGHYYLNAKVEGHTLLTREQMAPLLRSLLEERFHLVAHHEPKIVSGCALVVAKSGSRLEPNQGAPFSGMNTGFEIKFQNVPVESLARALAGAVKQPVVDRTGLQGMYDFDLKFAPQDPLPGASPEFASRYAGLPDIFTALQEQFGLRLVPEKITIDTLVIDHIDKIAEENQAAFRTSR